MAMNTLAGCLLLVFLWLGMGVLLAVFLRGSYGGDDEEEDSNGDKVDRFKPGSEEHD
jgi:hypothetical protein